MPKVFYCSLRVVRAEGSGLRLRVEHELCLVYDMVGDTNPA